MPKISQEKIERIKFLLSDMIKRYDLEGIMLSNKSGDLISEIFKSSFSFTQFSSMCASILKSALGLGKIIGKQDLNKIMVELEHHILIIFQITPELFMVLFITENSKSGILIRDIRSFLDKIVAIIYK